MADPLLEFDPTSEDASNSPLSVWNTASYFVTEFNPDVGNQTIQWASSVDTEGGLPASVKDEVRTISMTIECLSAAALRTLEAKVAKVSRERGTLKYTLPNGEVIIFDLLARESWKPGFDVTYFIHSGAYCTVNLGFTAKPYGRGPEEDLGDNTETTLPVLIFTETAVKGNVSALGRLVVDNDDASNAQRLLRWGVQSRYYSSASTAALFYEAESCAMAGASVATGPSGASGGASNNTAFLGTLPAYPSTAGIIHIGASSTAQTHIGNFRVLVRARVPSANTGPVYLRVAYHPEVGRSEVGLPLVPIVDATGASIEDEWVMVDLGLISLPKARAGTQGWIGRIEASATTFNDDLYIDWIALLPVDERSGEWIDGVAGSTSQIPASGSVQVRHDGVLTATSGGYLSSLNGYEGDYLLVPPAGLEARTVRVIVKFSRGQAGFIPPTESTSEVFVDAGTDDLSARLFVTPRYLVVPSP